MFSIKNISIFDTNNSLFGRNYPGRVGSIRFPDGLNGMPFLFTARKENCKKGIG